MNNPRILFLIPMIILGFPAIAEDQPVSQIPASAAWEMTPTAPTKTTPLPQGSIQKLMIERSGNLQRVQIDIVGEGTQTVWLAHGEIFSEVNNTVSSARSNAWTPAMFSFGLKFFGTEWIQSGHLIGTQEVAGKTVEVYRAKLARDPEKAAATMTGISPEDLAVELEAWIDPITRMPVKVSAPEGTFIYKFLPTPTSPLQLPTAFRAKQDERDREIKRQQAEAAIR